MWAAARAARELAYAPYSGFKVGAAVLVAIGYIHTGVNVENASYGLSSCAERAALAAAVAAGALSERPLRGLVIAADRPSPPRGACRQWLQELAPAAVVGWGDGAGGYEEHA